MTAKSDLAEAVVRAKREREYLQERIEELNLKTKELTAKIQKIDGFICYADEYLSDRTRSKENDRNIELPIQDEVFTEEQDYNKMSVSQVVESVLRKNGKPMQVKAMVSALWKAGYRRYSTKQKLYTSLYTTMSRRKKFYKTEEEATFGLTERKETENAPS